MPELFKCDGYDAGGWRGSHVAESHHRRIRFFLCEHCRILFQRCGVLPSNRFPVIHKIADPHLAKALLDADEDFAVIAEAEFRVVIKENLALFQLFEAGSGG